MTDTPVWEDTLHEMNMLRIWQQNLNKSLIATEHMLNSTAPEHFDIIAIQEPYIDFTRNARVKQQWYLIYSKTHYIEQAGRTRSMILVNKNIASKSWTEIDIESPDVTGIQKHSDAIRKANKHLQEYRRKNDNNDSNTEIIWVGDFNRHHPIWDDPKNLHLFMRSNIDAAQTLLDALAEHDLYMALPKFIPTLKAMATQNYTRPDNVFISHTLQDAIITCSTSPEEQPTWTDHFPINTTLAMKTHQTKEHPRHNFWDVKWPKFREALAEKLWDETLSEPVISAVDLAQKTDALSQIIADTIKAVVPLTKPSPYTKRWWTWEITSLRQITRRKARRAYKYKGTMDHPAHGEYQKAQNKYPDAISKAKKDKWDEFLEKLDEHTVWAAHKYASAQPSDGGRSQIPDLMYKDAEGRARYATTNEGKAKVFRDSFFGTTDQTCRINPEEYTYPDPAFRFQPITDQQIYQAIRKTSPYKACMGTQLCHYDIGIK
jgi:Endonuclease-reverse transcriptase